MSSLSPDVCRLVLVGSASRREFSALVTWLTEHPQIRIVGHFRDVAAALDGWDSLAAEPEMTVVLQSWSDESSPSDVDQLIGKTLFRRLLCCFGPWCESDGRNRNAWPDALHVPVRLAESVLASELHWIATAQPPIAPTAARDEVFAHRMSPPADRQSSSGLQHMNAAVFSPDQVFRKTVCLTLRDYGLRALQLPPVTSRRRVIPMETPRGPIHLVFHDLDPWNELTEYSLTAARRMFPAATVLGLASMPDAGISTEIVDARIDAVIPKLDFENGLRWYLKCLLESDPQERVHSQM